jgi:hypothetical protein
VPLGRRLYGRAPADELSDYPVHLESELLEGDPICVRPDADDDVGRDGHREQAQSGELSESPLQSIPHDCRLSKARNDQPDTCPFAFGKHERGSDGPNLEMSGSETLPLLRDTLQFRASRDAYTPRKA